MTHTSRIKVQLIASRWLTDQCCGMGNCLSNNVMLPDLVSIKGREFRTTKKFSNCNVHHRVILPTKALKQYPYVDTVTELTTVDKVLSNTHVAHRFPPSAVTPSFNLHHLIFVLTPFGSLHSVTLTPTYLIFLKGISFLIHAI